MMVRKEPETLNALTLSENHYFLFSKGWCFMVFPGGLAELVLLTQLQGLMWDLHASAFSKPSKIDAQEKYADIKALFEMGFINY